jgi:predicted dehydrogenase
MTEIENYDIHDTSVVTLLFDSGAIGQITSGCIAENNGGSRVDIVVKGRDWQAQVGDDATLKDAEGEQKIESNLSWQEQLGQGDNAFLNAVRSGDKSAVTSDYRSGVQTLAITLAANESMATGQPVKVQRFV